MPIDRSDAPRRFQLPMKLAAMALMVAAAGLPIGHLFEYLLLAMAVVVLAVGRVTARRGLWLAAVAVTAAAIALKVAAGAPKIEEGHNVFLPDGESNALTTGLPAAVFRTMQLEFDKASPPAKRCAPEAFGCWQRQGRPKRVYAFSFDGLYDTPAYSRRVTGIAFSDPLWQRLGFINELTYNWATAEGDIGRAARPRGLQRLWRPWLVAMPHFVMFQFPAAFAGSELCWRGHVMWEQEPERFVELRHAEMTCRTIAPNDAGKRIYGLAIAPDAPLAMRLNPTPAIRLHQIVPPALALAAILAVLLLLVRWEARGLRLPMALIGLSSAVILINDVSFVGGVRPFDGGNDGLVYDGWARDIVQMMLAGDVRGALMGMEPVYHFTPGARYLRAVEHLIFGETYLGYVSLMLLLPFLVLALFRRYFSPHTAAAFALVFAAIPIGTLFGSTLYLYVKYAAQGFGDPAAAILFLSGVLVLVRPDRLGPDARFAPALGAGFLFALALFLRPNLAVGAAVFLGGAGLAALRHGQIGRLAGLCIGFAPVFGMTLHNWYYGGVFVLFSGHFNLPEAMPAPPGAYAAALWELARFDFGGSNLARVAAQVCRMLTGPSEYPVMAPLHALALAVVGRVALARGYDGWLRLTAAGTLGLHAPALFFIYAGRYHHLAWLLTLLVCAVWIRDEAWPWVRGRLPGLARAVEENPARPRIERLLDGLMRPPAARA